MDATDVARRAGEADADANDRDVRGSLLECIRCCDLTTLEHDDDEDKIVRLAYKAIRPGAAAEDVPRVAAICTWPRLIPAAASVVEGSGVRLAAVAGDFPGGRASTDEKVAEVGEALAAGAQEIDTVINRDLLVAGDDEAVYEEVRALRAAAGRAVLKVILETGELVDLDLIRKASLVALAAGADFIKTSTGKIVPGATPAAVVVMADAIKDFYAKTARAAGLKVAGGVRAADDALRYVHIVQHALGPEWVVPERFRIGASSLLDDLVVRVTA